jgi:hypothetical protein
MNFLAARSVDRANSEFSNQHLHATPNQSATGVDPEKAEG